MNICFYFSVFSSDSWKMHISLNETLSWRKSKTDLHLFVTRFFIYQAICLTNSSLKREKLLEMCLKNSSNQTNKTGRKNDEPSRAAIQMVASVIYLFTLHLLTPLVVCDLLPGWPTNLWLLRRVAPNLEPVSGEELDGDTEWSGKGSLTYENMQLHHFKNPNLLWKTQENQSELHVTPERG